MLVLDHVPVKQLRNKTIFKESSGHAKVVQMTPAQLKKLKKSSTLTRDIPAREKLWDCFMRKRRNVSILIRFIRYWQNG
jgi:hypothetical protein